MNVENLMKDDGTWEKRIPIEHDYMEVLLEALCIMNSNDRRPMGIFVKVLPTMPKTYNQYMEVVGTAVYTVIGLNGTNFLGTTIEITPKDEYYNTLTYEGLKELYDNKLKNFKPEDKKYVKFQPVFDESTEADLEEEGIVLPLLFPEAVIRNEKGIYIECIGVE